MFSDMALSRECRDIEVCFSTADGRTGGGVAALLVKQQMYAER